MVEGYYTPTATSVNWYTGIECASAPHAEGELRLYKFELLGPWAPAAPAAPVMRADGAADGSKSAILTITPPTTNLRGEPLTGLVQLQVFRDGESLATVPVSGPEVVWRDDTVTPGEHTYAVAAFTADGMGESVSATAFVGNVAPADVAELTLAYGEHTGSVHLSWPAVTTDANGKQLTGVKYNVYRIDSAGAGLVAENLETNEFVHGVSTPDTPQYFTQYGVEAVSDTGVSARMTLAAQPIAVGRSYTLPFQEAFDAQGAPRYNWAVDTRGTGAQWGIADDEMFVGMTSPDNDGGFMVYNGESAGDSSTLTSGLITIPADMKNPVLVLQYFSIAADYGNDIELKVIVDRQVKSLGYCTPSSTPLTWVRKEVSLKEYAGRNIQIAIDVTTDNYATAAFDNIRVYNLLDNDMNTVTLTAPSALTAGIDNTFTVRYMNTGRNTADGYTVSLLCNGDVLEQRTGKTLAQDESAVETFAVNVDATFESAEYQAVVEWSSDETPDDNVSPTVTPGLYPSDLPQVTDLTAVRNDDKSVSVLWSTPDLPDNAGSISEVTTLTDSFEDYEVGATEFGRWTIIDEDGLRIGGTMDIDFPGIEERRGTVGFFVFDLSKTSGIDPENPFTYNFTPRTGNKCIMNMYPIDPTEGPASDWAITPRLSGNAQTVSFWAKSGMDRYLETFEVMISVDGCQPEHFTRAALYNNVPSMWTEYKVSVPQGTQYVAIHCISYDRFSLMIDDVVMELAPNAVNLLGYNLYRDGAKINVDMLAEPTYADADASLEQTTYHVTAMYETGESALSAPAVVDAWSGISTPESNAYTVSVANRTVTVTCQETSSVAIYDVAGRCVYAGHGPAEVSLLPGIYVVTVDDAATSIAVR